MCISAGEGSAPLSTIWKRIAFTIMSSRIWLRQSVRATFDWASCALSLFMSPPKLSFTISRTRLSTSHSCISSFFPTAASRMRRRLTASSTALL